MSLNGRSGGPVIAVDAMGGDFAPAEVVKGAIEAHRRGIEIVLVGQPRVVTPELEKHRGSLPVTSAEDVIVMDERVSLDLLRRRSSMRVAMELVSTGDASACVSCGNSGAILALAGSIWKKQMGIDRPAFGGTLPGRNGGVFVLDIGANTTVKATNLVQFAVMGEVFVQVSQGIERPRIGLLSNGSEESKGTEEVKEANAILRKLDMNFVGNIEGNQVLDGSVDVVVTDGFTGNVLLKSSEGVAAELLSLLRQELTRDIVSRVAAAALMPSFDRIRRRVDYEEYGGAPVLGVNGVMINCHGRSKAKAVTNAICMAERMARENLLGRIGGMLTDDGVAVGRGRRLARALHLGDR